MKYKVLITAPYFQLVVDRYRETFTSHSIEVVVPLVNERMSEEELIPLVYNIHGIICGDDRITERVLANAPYLKVIVKWGTGIDSIDQEAAAKRGIPVRNTPNAFTEPVADTILSSILCFARGTIDLDKKVRKGIWEKKLNKALSECTLGVVGMGNIGQAVIKRAEAFGMKILANDIVEKPFNFMVSLEKLLRESDFVALCTDLNPTSYHLMNKKTLSMMKPTAYLINASRGPLIEERALIDTLENGRLAGAALDVFEHEPLPHNHPFKTMDNVILSPHNANSSLQAWERVHANSVKHLIEVLKESHA
ncbi:MAG: phosphoglycerate dehydrogenase [Candidatus Zambryskibacteria bacterium]|nr:phosphoglycerate dehydrogenase [Candidatus Zambryskibacteria bacterium]